ncbi:uncharacterized protein BCR38DRAFT_486256 [Pseudomassariella vexata]|uniref:Uncharacterized protein n=1 Tax=Pseudomassariella vexata TaxID=1141098 RepID=A0A1Y2DW51_9PEZI|nr:uncharacterized protein BCR38DRAFT_486256 [Pseudomassariella vexata]ORY63520.1 hypothetical protein BCR38DRAFT_486256 [Pseudomassariella vexata]
MDRIAARDSARRWPPNRKDCGLIEEPVNNEYASLPGAHAYASTNSSTQASGSQQEYTARDVSFQYPWHSEQDQGQPRSKTWRKRADLVPARPPKRIAFRSSSSFGSTSDAVLWAGADSDTAIHTLGNQQPAPIQTQAPNAQPAASQIQTHAPVETQSGGPNQKTRQAKIAADAIEQNGTVHPNGEKCKGCEK